jgi:hypothetical protein
VFEGLYFFDVFCQFFAELFGEVCLTADFLEFAVLDFELFGVEVDLAFQVAEFLFLSVVVAMWWAKILDQGTWKIVRQTAKLVKIGRNILPQVVQPRRLPELPSQTHVLLYHPREPLYLVLK